MAKWVRCNQPLRDGSPCKQVKTATAERCDSCARRLAREIARAEALAEEEALLAAEAEAQAEIESAGEGPVAGPVSRHQVRGLLGDDFAANLAMVRKSLTDAMDQTRGHKVVCAGCGRENTVHVPDNRARVAAIKLWSELGLGKTPPAAPETPVPVTDKPLEQMTDDELDELIRAAAA